MITGIITLASLMTLFLVLFSKVMCLAKKWFFARKDFILSCLEMGAAALALAFLVVVTLANVFHSTLDELMLAWVMESSIYLYMGTFLFTIIGFLWILEAFTIVVNDIWGARKGFMSSRKRFMGQS